MSVLIFESLEHQKQNGFTNHYFDQLINVVLHSIQRLDEWNEEPHSSIDQNGVL
jgi:hypothetical protein